MTTLLESLELNLADGPVFFGLAERRGMEAFCQHDGTEDIDNIAAAMYAKAKMTSENRAVFYVAQMSEDRADFYKSLIERLEGLGEQATELAEHLNHEFLRHLQRDGEIKLHIPAEFGMFMCVIPGDDPDGWVALESVKDEVAALIANPDRMRSMLAEILELIDDENEETTDAPE